MFMKSVKALLGAPPAPRRKSTPLTVGKAARRVGKFGAMAVLALANAQIVAIVVESTPLMAHSSGSVASTMESHNRCSRQMSAMGEQGMHPGAAMAKARYRCALGLDDAPASSDGARDAELQEQFKAMAGSGVMSLVPESASKRWFMEGANAAPAADTPLGALMGMGAIEMAQAEAIEEGLPDLVEEEALAARDFMRQVYPYLVSQALRSDGLDRDISPMLWSVHALSGKAPDGQFFAVFDDHMRVKILAAFWRTQHPALTAEARSDAMANPPSHGKTAANREKSEQWAKGIAPRDGLRLAWIDQASKDQP